MIFYKSYKCYKCLKRYFKYVIKIYLKEKIKLKNYLNKK